MQGSDVAELKKEAVQTLQEYLEGIAGPGVSLASFTSVLVFKNDGTKLSDSELLKKNQGPYLIIIPTRPAPGETLLYEPLSAFEPQSLLAYPAVAPLLSSSSPREGVPSSFEQKPQDKIKSAADSVVSVSSVLSVSSPSTPVVVTAPYGNAEKQSNVNSNLEEKFQKLLDEMKRNASEAAEVRSFYEAKIEALEESSSAKIKALEESQRTFSYENEKMTKNLIAEINGLKAEIDEVRDAQERTDGWIMASYMAPIKMRHLLNLAQAQLARSVDGLNIEDLRSEKELSSAWRRWLRNRKPSTLLIDSDSPYRAAGDKVAHPLFTTSHVMVQAVEEIAKEADKEGFSIIIKSLRDVGVLT